MAEKISSEIKVFYCYAREDKVLREELEVNLASLKRQYRLTTWSDHEILPGEDFEQAINTHLSTADLVLLLISPHFMNSDYCYSKEMDQALTRQKEGTCIVISILVQPTYWEEAPFSHLQLLPTDARAITSWPNRYEAFYDVARGISASVKAFQQRRAAIQRREEGIALYNLKRYEEALAAFEQVIGLDPTNARAYNSKGVVLDDLKRYEEALAAYEQALRLDPTYVVVYSNKGNALLNLKRYEEALAAYEQAIGLDPTLAVAYYNKGNALIDLKRYEEALAACEQALRLDPTDAVAYYNKGVALHNLKRYEEALAAYEQAIGLDPNYTNAYTNKNDILRILQGLT